MSHYFLLRVLCPYLTEIHHIVPRHYVQQAPRDGQRKKEKEKKKRKSLSDERERDEPYTAEFEAPQPPVVESLRAELFICYIFLSTAGATMIQSTTKLLVLVQKQTFL